MRETRDTPSAKRLNRQDQTDDGEGFQRVVCPPRRAVHHGTESSDHTQNCKDKTENELRPRDHKVCAPHTSAQELLLAGLKVTESSAIPSLLIF